MEEQNQSASQRIYKIDTAMLSWLLLLLYKMHFTKDGREYMKLPATYTNCLKKKVVPLQSIEETQGAPITII